VALAVGPVADRVLAATEGLDVTVLYTPTPRPLDTAMLRAAVPDAHADILLVEPDLAGTSSRVVAAALEDRPHRIAAPGVGGGRGGRAGRGGGGLRHGGGPRRGAGAGPARAGGPGPPVLRRAMTPRHVPACLLA